MKSRVALVLSGGGMFGAWQAGAWRALAERVQPDLVVGASVGSLNGYVIASGASPDTLVELWRSPDFCRLDQLRTNVEHLVERFTPRAEFAVVLTDVMRLKAKIFHAHEVNGSHLAASCAIPLVLPPVKINGRWYNDGGLLNPLPVWAAVELGATQIFALHALPEIPSPWLKPFAQGFRWVFGHNPPLPPGIELVLLKPKQTLGDMRSAIYWKRENIERWLEEGYREGATSIAGQSIRA